MNTFYEHHKHSIKFAYRCFDRILLNGLIQPFQQPERLIGFFNAYREGLRVTRNLLGDIAQQFQNWLKNRCQKWGTLSSMNVPVHSEALLLPDSRVFICSIPRYMIQIYWFFLLLSILHNKHGRPNV